MFVLSPAKKLEVEFKDALICGSLSCIVMSWPTIVGSIIASNGILEVAYNNGEVHFEETATGKKWIEGQADSKKTLIQRFEKFMADVNIGRDPYGQ